MTLPVVVETPQTDMDNADVAGPGAAVTNLGRGMGWSYVQLGAAAVVSLVVAAVVLRRLGPAEFGVFALITAASSFVKTLDLGLGLTLVRATARQASTPSLEERDEARRDVTAAHSVYAALGLGAVAIMTILAALLPVLLGLDRGWLSDVRVTTMLVGLALGLFLGTSALSGLATGIRDFRARALSAVVGAVVSLVVVLTLVDRLGLVTLGVAELASVVCGRIVLVLWARRSVPWFPLRPRRLSRLEARRVVAVALPLVVLAVGGQVIASTDLFILGGLYTAATVGLYRIGSLLATQAIIVLYQGFDVVLPALAATRDRVLQEKTMAFLTRIGCYVGGVVLGTMAFQRHDLVLVLTGGRSSLAASVLLVFCCIWLANLVSHGLALLLIARGRQRILLWPVVGEMAFNLALTFVLLRAFGPIGAAISTLITVGVSHTIIVPIVARHELASGAARLIILDGWIPLAAGLAVAAGCFGAVSALEPSLVRILAGSTLAATAGLAVGGLLLRDSGREAIGSLLRRAPIEL